jgi:hypothetical protein
VVLHVSLFAFSLVRVLLFFLTEWFECYLLSLDFLIVLLLRILFAAIAERILCAKFDQCCFVLS